MARTVGMAELPGLVGERLGTAEWLEVTQARIDEFARATGDQQWIHVDPERAARESPYGRTIAHGYMSLGLVPALLFDLIEVTGVRAVLNYGANKVRFPAPVPVGSRLRLSILVTAVEPVDGGLQVAFTATVELQGAAKPAMVADLVFRFIG